MWAFGLGQVDHGFETEIKSEGLAKQGSLSTIEVAFCFCLYMYTPIIKHTFCI